MFLFSTSSLPLPLLYDPKIAYRFLFLLYLHHIYIFYTLRPQQTGWPWLITAALVKSYLHAVHIWLNQVDSLVCCIICTLCAWVTALKSLHFKQPYYYSKWMSQDSGWTACVITPTDGLWEWPHISRKGCLVLNISKHTTFKHTSCELFPHTHT